MPSLVFKSMVVIEIKRVKWWLSSSDIVMNLGGLIKCFTVSLVDKDPNFERLRGQVATCMWYVGNGEKALNDELLN